MSRIIIVHSREPQIVLDPTKSMPTPAHCFGPFANYEDALAFDRTMPDDCWKVALDLVGPHLVDVESQEHGPHHELWHGSGPSKGTP